MQLLDYETKEVESLCSLLLYLELNEGNDELVWLCKNSDFSVKTCYIKLFEVRLQFFNTGIVNFCWGKFGG